MTTLTANSLLMALNVKEKDKFILIKEHDLADSNFTITHLTKQFLEDEKNKICFVMLHNTPGHYHNVGKKLGYDLGSKIKNGKVKMLEPMTSIFQELIANSYNAYLSNKVRGAIISALWAAIKAILDELMRDGDGKIFLIIDDLSHLFDIGVESRMILRFISVLTSEIFDKNVHLVINMHIGDENDYRISSALEYNADVNIDVAPLKTGRSFDVTGVLTVVSSDGSQNIYHYKALDREIRTFRPGDMYNLIR